jgi:hypothetical protein
MSDTTPPTIDDEVPLEVIVLLLRIKTEIAREDIEALRRIAIYELDDELADLCEDALNGDQASWCACGQLIIEHRDKLQIARRNQLTHKEIR